VKPARGKLNLVPLQIARLGRSQVVPVRDQDYGGIAMPVSAAFPSRRHQRLDLGARQILARSATVEFTMVGAASLPACESMKKAPPCNVTVEQLVISSTVSRDETRVSQTVAKTHCRLR